MKNEDLALRTTRLSAFRIPTNLIPHIEETADTILDAILVYLPGLKKEEVIGSTRNRRHESVSARYTLLYLLDMTVYHSLPNGAKGILIGLVDIEAPHCTVINAYHAFAGTAPERKPVDLELMYSLVINVYQHLGGRAFFDKDIADHELEFKPYEKKPPLDVKKVLKKIEDSKPEPVESYPLYALLAAVLLDADGELISKMKFCFYKDALLTRAKSHGLVGTKQNIPYFVLEQVLCSMKSPEDYIDRVHAMLQETAA